MSNVSLTNNLIILPKIEMTAINLLNSILFLTPFFKDWDGMISAHFHLSEETKSVTMLRRFKY